MPMTAPATKGAAPAEFDGAAIRSHVELLHRLADGVEGVLVVSVFHAQTTSANDAPGTVTHHVPGDVDGMVAAIEAHRETVGANVYCGLQVMRRELARGKRGTESDIVAVLGLVADMDSDTGKDGGTYPMPPNMVLETSPGNRQPFWLFDRPLVPSVAKAVAKSLKAATGSDHGTADITHVWRVPGTMNWPNKAKLERGRSPDPATVVVAQPWDGTFTDTTALAVALSQSAGHVVAAPVELGDLPTVDGVEVSLEAADLLGANDVGDRSAHAARVVERLAFDGFAAEVAAALFLSATGDWLGRYPTRHAARADFSRLWGKFAKDTTPVATGAIAALTASKPKREPPVPANDNNPFPGILTSGEFVSGFAPPDYLVDGILQSGFLYSITGQTGSGKTAVALLVAACVAMGEMLAGLEVKRGRVLYFAGENPDDVRMRWIGLCHEIGIDPTDIDAHFVEGVFSISEFAQRIEKDVERLGGVAAIFVDTTAAYFPGTDENSNVEMGQYARLLRSLTRMECRPAVIAASHPIKNAAADNLLPRGGGAFLNEVDGNLSLAKRGDRSAELHWQGKFRGPDFKPIMFDLPAITVPTLVDSRGREIPTVRAVVVGETEIAARAHAATREDQRMLLAIRQDGNRSLRELGEFLGLGEGDAAKRRAQTITDRLKRSQHISYDLGVWKLTKKGTDAATQAGKAVHEEDARAEAIKGFLGNHRRKRGGAYRARKEGTDGE